MKRLVPDKAEEREEEGKKQTNKNLKQEEAS